MAPITRSKPQQKGVKRKSNELLNFTFNTRLNTNRILTEVANNSIKSNAVKCKFCHQTKTEDVNIPLDAESECIVLANEKLANIYTDEFDDEIQHNVTNFSIYDENMHMCSIDSGIVEKNVLLYLTGYVKPSFDNASSIEEGIAAKELGPILEWWVTSFDEGSRVIIGVSTEYADYLLIEPHLNYKKYMTSVIEKSHLSTLVIESILDSEFDNPTYEDVLNCIVNSVNPATGNKFSEEDLIAHAPFVLDQVADYDSNDTHHLPLNETKCIETLTELSGAAKPSSRILERRQRNRVVKSSNSKREFSKATTTELVKDIFENMFAAQLDNNDKENEITMNKRIMTVFDDMCKEGITKQSSEMNTDINNQVMWEDQILHKKMFILVKNYESELPMIGRIEYFYKKNAKDMAHMALFIHGYATVLGETADRQELFALKKCTNIIIQNIITILDVKHKQFNNNWFNLGGSKLQDILEPVNRNNNNSFFHQLEYDGDYGRFEYPKIIEPCNIKKDKYCNNCKVQTSEDRSQIPIPLKFMEKNDNLSYYENFKLNYKTYKIGNFVYLKPGIFLKHNRFNFVNDEPLVHKKSKTNETNKNERNLMLKKVDETMYPEYYRKKLESKCGSNETTPDPFEIAEILSIYIHDEDPKLLKLIVRRMYRAEQMEGFDKHIDMNLLFWSDEQFGVLAKNIYGQCFVAFNMNIIDPFVWSLGGPDRFYFIRGYDFLTDTIIPEFKLPDVAKLTGKEVFVNYEYRYIDWPKIQYIPSFDKIEPPLNGLDIFAGCGGLSKGLEESGLVKSKWAIECDNEAAAAFKLNNPESNVFIEDCNHLLKLVMSGHEFNSKNQKIPQKGDIDFICGGPPCQGFSGMNRFNSGQYSLFKNSLIVSFLSYIDYYRPKYFVMENVRNFVSFKSNMVFKLTLRCITRMGYQCTFGVLQAGNFGVPQTRRRLILIAAAPGEKLPLYPEPTHVFNPRNSSTLVQIGDSKFKTNCKYGDSAPMRTVTVYDALSDLPSIQNGANDLRIPYKSAPITHLQRLLRYPNNSSLDSVLTDHICKDMSPLVQARMELIPLGEGSDWRDLPNTEVQLCDGSKTKKLVYTHNDIKNGKYNCNSGVLRGVCQCASGGHCDPNDKQYNTIIPWCLPHTAVRHNNWAGLYGRLGWSGFCSTTITNPEPMGKQGRVLHPEQNRVVSVRECARSQGFNDSYSFCGPIINKHRQVGNAVPPPMGKAIGHEIIKAIKENKNLTVNVYH